MPDPVTRSDARPFGVQTVAGSILGSDETFGHEIISTAILSLPLIQVGQLSVTGERMCTKYWLGISLPRISAVRLTDRPDMAIVVDCDVEPQNKQNLVLTSVPIPIVY